MLPVLTVAEMQAADRAALDDVDEDVLVERAGFALSRAAFEMLGTCAGRRVVVVAGKGNNGADGRVAARLLRRRGAQVQVVPAVGAPDPLPRCDLVIDAAFGTGFRGEYQAPEPPPGAAVLAVDIPSGVSGDTGAAAGRPLAAARTVTMAAWKLGLLQGDGRDLAGHVTVADIGIPVASAGIGLVEDEDVAWLPARPRDTHKWASALCVVAGSPGMEGAAVLATRAAMRSGAGMVRLAVPGSAHGGGSPGGSDGASDGRSSPGPQAPWPLEAVRVPVPTGGWADRVLEDLDRCQALVVGPGLGRDAGTVAEVRRLVARSPVPTVVDADGLFALAGPDGAPAEAPERPVGAPPLVLTPHDGEYRLLAGDAPGPDRVAAARALARRLGAVVLLKGSLTAVADPSTSSGRGPGGPSAPAWPDGEQPDVVLAAAGSPRLATAGTGDVLSGVIGGFLARGVPATEAAALAAHVHGRAAGTGPAALVAGDLPDLIGQWIDTTGRGVGAPAGRDSTAGRGCRDPRTGGAGGWGPRRAKSTDRTDG